MPELFICDSVGKPCADCGQGVPHEKEWVDAIDKNWCSDVKVRCFAFNKKVRCIPYKEVKP